MPLTSQPFSLPMGPASAKLQESFFVMDSSMMMDDASVTSSTISDDEHSWVSDDNDEDELNEEEQEALELEAAHAVAKMVRDRSTVSLGAYFNRTPRMTAPTPRTIKATPAPPRVVSRAASTMDLKRPASSGSLHQRQPVLQAIQRVSAQAPSSSSKNNNNVKPDDYLCQLLDTQLEHIPFESLGDYFLTITSEHTAAWDAQLLRAIRTHDLPLLQKMHQAGSKMQASNQFGESVLHVCVRRGTPAILNYLLNQGQVSPRVHCDYGRTPLHDAFWTFSNEPRSVQMIALLLKQCPEMLLIKDKRGFTPLDYVPHGSWEDCRRLLDRCAPLLQRLKNNGRSC